MAGIDAEKIPQALKGGLSDSDRLQEYLRRFAVRDYRRKGRIYNIVKGLNAVKDPSRRAGS